MSAPQPLDLASELEVAADIVVGEYPEAVYYCCRLPDGLYNLIRIKIYDRLE